MFERGSPHERLNLNDNRASRYGNNNYYNNQQMDSNTFNQPSGYGISAPSKQYFTDYQSFVPDGVYSGGPSIVAVEPIDDDDDGIYCTDTTWLGGYGGLMALALLILIYSFIKTDRDRLSAFPDFKGDYCGLSGPVKGKPYLYYPLDPSARKPQLLLHAGQCVDSCPEVKDVGSPIPIPMMQNEIDEANPGTSGIMVRYIVQSPKYATEVAGGNQCLPLDKGLRKVVLTANSTLNAQARRAVGTVTNAWPAILRDVAIALLVFGFLTQVLLSALPRITVQFTAVLFITGYFLLTFLLTWWGFRGASKLPYQYAELFSWSVASAQALGILYCILSPMALIFVSSNWGVFWEGATVFESLKDSIRDLNRTIIVPVVLSCASICGLYVWIRVLQSMLSSSVLRPVKGYDGMINAVPFYNESVHMTAGTIALSLCFTIAFFWSIYSIRSAARFCGAYVGLVWFFSPVLKCGCDERDIGNGEGIRALQTSFSISYGSNLLYGLFLYATELIIKLFGFASRRKSPHLTPSDGDQLSEGYPTNTVTESSEVAQWIAYRLRGILPSIAAIIDCVHCAALTEVVLNGSDLVIGIDTSRKRMVTRGPLMRPTVAGRFVGSYGMTGTLMTLALCFWTAISTFISISSKSVFYKLADDGTPRVEESFGFFQYSHPSSSSFVSNPVLGMILSSAIVFLVCDSFCGFYEGIIDAIAYLYIVDIQQLSDRSAEVNQYGACEEEPFSVDRAPIAFKRLLIRVMEDELGIIHSSRKGSVSITSVDGQFTDSHRYR